jgi:hypothetical protein
MDTICIEGSPKVTVNEVQFDLPLSFKLVKIEDEDQHMTREAVKALAGFIIECRIKQIKADQEKDPPSLPDVYTWN